MTVPSSDLRIIAPLAGILVPLERVPDPVFAQRMVGDGISLDPTSDVLLAPVAGTVTQLHDAHHALTITTDGGVEVLVHVGLDTVKLRGEGFSPRVKLGDRVEVGQPVLGFDADLVARRARSLLTEIVIANPDKVARMTPPSGRTAARRCCRRPSPCPTPPACTPARPRCWRRRRRPSPPRSTSS